jgi:hypothetical protein
MCKNTHDNSGWGVIALLLIGLGVMSLMGVGLLWPMFIMVPGLIMLSLVYIGGRAGAAAFSIPGMIVTGIGALLFAQNLTGYWESWAYAWTLCGVFLGMGFMLMGQRLEDSALHRFGRHFAHVSLVALAGFAFLFEIIIGISGHSSLKALLLIGLGLFLATRGTFGPQVALALDRGVKSQPNRKTKPKREADKLFTGPIVYGTRVTSRSAARLSVSEAEDIPNRYDSGP